jgi:uroporphyrinogen III methyltransferase/synthase
MLGLVSFVSIGPGDALLLVERAARRISAADVVVGERERRGAGELVDLARTGKRVVRLVAGDALESSDVLEEVRAVARAGVPFEVVPGVGARAAAAAFAGVLGRAVRVAAGDVAHALADAPRDAVVTLVARAGDATQAVVVTSAAQAPARARELWEKEVVVAFGAPVDELRWFERRPLFGKRVVVTRARDQAEGTAALLRDEGAEPIVLPAIVLAPPADPAPLARAVEELRAGAYAWAAFTSANGVERTWEAIVAAGGDARSFAAARLAAIGPATAAALERHGLRPDVVAKEFRGEGLAAEMLAAMTGPNGSPHGSPDSSPSGSDGSRESLPESGPERKRASAGAPESGPERKRGSRVLLARAARARDALPEALRATGHAVDVVAAYETHAAPREAIAALAATLEAGRVDAVTFTSSSTVDHVCDALDGTGAGAAALLARVRVASIGPVTSATARGRGVRVDVEAAPYTLPALVSALAESYGPHKR